MNEDVWNVLDDSEKRKLRFEQENHRQFFEGTERDDEHWVLGLTEDDEDPFYRNEAYKYYYRIDSPLDAEQYIDSDKSWTIQLDRVAPDSEGEAEWIVKETNDFHFIDELREFVEDYE